MRSSVDSIIFGRDLDGSDEAPPVIDAAHAEGAAGLAGSTRPNGVGNLERRHLQRARRRAPDEGRPNTQAQDRHVRMSQKNQNETQPSLLRRFTCECPLLLCSFAVSSEP